MAKLTRIARHKNQRVAFSIVIVKTSLRISPLLATTKPKRFSVSKGSSCKRPSPPSPAGGLRTQYFFQLHNRRICPQSLMYCMVLARMPSIEMLGILVVRIRHVEASSSVGAGSTCMRTRITGSMGGEWAIERCWSCRRLLSVRWSSTYIRVQKCRVIQLAKGTREDFWLAGTRGRNC